MLNAPLTNRWGGDVDLLLNNEKDLLAFCAWLRAEFDCKNEEQVTLKRVRITVKGTVIELFVGNHWANDFDFLRKSSLTAWHAHRGVAQGHPRPRLGSMVGSRAHGRSDLGAHLQISRARLQH